MILNRTVLVIAFIIAATAIAGEPIHRDYRQRSLFRYLHPCPSTGSTKGACPGYQIDHIKALELGGPDSDENMQWLTIEEHRKKTKQDNAAAR